MEVSSSQQMYVFILCLISGIVCGMFFDIQRSLRKISAAGGIRTVIEDTVFVAVCTGTAIGIGFLFNKGQIRYYQIMGLVSGALFYAAFLSRIMMRIMRKIYVFLRRFIIVPVITVLKAVFFPFVKLYSFLKKNFIKTKVYSDRFFRALKSKKKHLKKRMKML